MLHDKVVQVSLLGWAEVLAHRNLRDLLSGRQRQGGRVRGFPSPSPLLRGEGKVGRRFTILAWIATRGEWVHEKRVWSEAGGMVKMSFTG